MYILNDICYAGEMQDGIKVTEVKPLCGAFLMDATTSSVISFGDTILT